MNNRYTVKNEDKNYRIQDSQGEMNYKLIFNNRHDAVMHCQYLNQQYNIITLLKQENKEYKSNLLKIKEIIEQIHRESGELHIVELSIKIKELIRRVLP